METTELTFRKSGDVYEAKYTSAGAVTAQLIRESGGRVSVLGSIGGMRPTVMGVYENPYSHDALFDIEAPAGMEVTIRSASAVTEGKLLSE